VISTRIVAAFSQALASCGRKTSLWRICQPQKRRLNLRIMADGAVSSRDRSMRHSSGTSGRDASNRTIGSQTAADTHNLLHTIAAFREGARRLAAISDSSTRWAPPRDRLV
jgi:hypothetical protein